MQIIRNQYIALIYFQNKVLIENHTKNDVAVLLRKISGREAADEMMVVLLAFMQERNITVVTYDKVWTLYEQMATDVLLGFNGNNQWCTGIKEGKIRILIVCSQKTEKQNLAIIYLTGPYKIPHAHFSIICNLQTKWRYQRNRML